MRGDGEGGGCWGCVWPSPPAPLPLGSGETANGCTGELENGDVFVVSEQRLGCSGGIDLETRRTEELGVRIWEFRNKRHS